MIWPAMDDPHPLIAAPITWGIMLRTKGGMERNVKRYSD
jgi:hypothetical protein